MHSDHRLLLRPWGRLWAAPWSACGLLLAALPLAFGARARVVGGVLEVCGGPLERLRARPGQGARFAAITLGHVVLGVDAPTLAALRTHEHAHVRQYERWGPAFVPAYLAAGAWALLRGRRAWFDNPFERQARAAEETFR